MGALGGARRQGSAQVRIVDPRAGARTFAGAVAGLVVAGGIVLGGLPAVAAPPVPVGDHGPEGVSLQVGITGITTLSAVDTVAENPVPGGTLVVRGQGFVPFVTYDVHLHSTPTFLGTVTARADGTIELVTTIPLSTVAGPHYVVVTDPVSGASVRSASFDVRSAVGGTDGGGTGGGTTTGNGTTAEGGTPGKVPGPLASTGVTVVGTLAIAGGLVAGGAALRRRRTRAS